jgi:hypothetical protein
VSSLSRPSTTSSTGLRERKSNSRSASNVASGAAPSASRSAADVEAPAASIQPSSAATIAGATSGSVGSLSRYSGMDRG